MAMATSSTSNRHPVSSSLIYLLEFEIASLPLLEFYCIFFTLPILLTWQSQLAIAFGKLTACTADARIFMWLSCALWVIYLRVEFPLIMVLFSQIVYPIMLSSSIQSIIKKNFWIKSLGSSFFRQLMSSAFNVWKFWVRNHWLLLIVTQWIL